MFQVLGPGKREMVWDKVGCGEVGRFSLLPIEEALKWFGKFRGREKLAPNFSFRNNARKIFFSNIVPSEARRERQSFMWSHLRIQSEPEQCWCCGSLCTNGIPFPSRRKVHKPLGGWWLNFHHAAALFCRCWKTAFVTSIAGRYLTSGGGSTHDDDALDRPERSSRGNANFPMLLQR